MTHNPDFPFKPGTRMTPEAKIEMAKELINALWMWNVNKNDAVDILKIVIETLPNEVWPNNVAIEPSEGGRFN